jgi:hypothetical protein
MFGKTKINDPYNTMGAGSAKFRKKNGPVSEPVRKDRVLSLFRAMMVEKDIDDVDQLHDEPSPRYRAALRNLRTLEKQSTVAERQAAHEMAVRNGYRDHL